MFFSSDYESIPVPAGTKILYKCQEGWFSNGKTWHTGVCHKDGTFHIEPISECTTEKVKPEEKDSSKTSTVKHVRIPQRGGNIKIKY